MKRIHIITLAIVGTSMVSLYFMADFPFGDALSTASVESPIELDRRIEASVESPIELDRKIEASFRASNVKIRELIDILGQVSDRASADKAADRLYAWRSRVKAEADTYALDFFEVRNNSTYIRLNSEAVELGKQARRTAFDIWDKKCYGSQALRNIIRTLYAPNGAPPDDYGE